jgi:hypothetical protein
MFPWYADNRNGRTPTKAKTTYNINYWKKMLKSIACFTLKGKLNFITSWNHLKMTDKEQKDIVTHVLRMLCYAKIKYSGAVMKIFIPFQHMMTDVCWFSSSNVVCVFFVFVLTRCFFNVLIDYSWFASVNFSL